MDNNEFYMRNTGLLALMESEEHPQSKEEMVDEILSSYNNVAKDQIMRRIDEFASKEELEHYIHSLAVHNHDRPGWE